MIPVWQEDWRKAFYWRRVIITMLYPYAKSIAYQNSIVILKLTIWTVSHIMRQNSLLQVFCQEVKCTHEFTFQRDMYIHKKWCSFQQGIFEQHLSQMSKFGYGYSWAVVGNMAIRYPSRLGILRDRCYPYRWPELSVMKPTQQLSICPFS